MKVDRHHPADSLRIGDVVRSVSGRDRKRVFVVVEYDECDKTAPIVIANGSLRPLSDRKHKNPMHLRWVAALPDSDIIELKTHPTDSRIAELCERFDKDEKMSGKS